ncbi:ABC transporter substrate-binding protein [Paenibacillus sp. GCM10027628]|uniref:ABC transporter substrate-binding protein n=1 Tax=Paenibacillus sp. GCM10027628 TaxID=3273413 RepID=UPI0036330569
MKRKLKITTLALASMLSLSTLLSACGEKQNASPSPAASSTPGSSAAATESSKKLDPYVITWYLPQSVFPDAKAVAEEMSKITKEKINATLDIQLVDWGAYDQKMQTLLATGEKADLIFTSNWTNDYVQNVNKGAFLDITDLLPKYGPDILKQVPKNAWDAAKIKGKLYAIINTQVLARTPGVLLNKTYVDKYGFKPDQFKKLEDLTPFLEKIAQNEKDKYAFSLKSDTDVLGNYGSALGLEYFSQKNPGVVRIDDNSSKVVNVYETPEFISFLKQMREWNAKGIIRKDASTLKDVNADENAGKYISSTFTVINPDSAANVAQKFGGGDATNVLPVEFSKPYMSTGSIIATMTAVSRTSKDPARAIMFYNLLYSDPKLFNLMSYGIEGKHYTKVGDDLIKKIDNAGYWADSGWEYGNMFNSYRTSPTQPKWYPAGPDKNAAAIPSKLLGFSFDPTNVKSELAQTASVVDEFYAGLITGTADPDVYLPKMNDKLKKAGLDKLLAEMQKQIDAWKASK